MGSPHCGLWISDCGLAMRILLWRSGLADQIRNPQFEIRN